MRYMAMCIPPKYVLEEFNKGRTKESIASELVRFGVYNTKREALNYVCEQIYMVIMKGQLSFPGVIQTHA